MAGPIDEAHRANLSVRLLRERAQKPFKAVESTIEAELCEHVLEKLQIFVTLVEGLGDVRQSSLILSFSSV